MENIKLSSEEWNKFIDVMILDPDGWDRKNFDVSWNEKITFDEFYSRMTRSTTGGGFPRMDFDKMKAHVFDKILQNQTH